MTLNTRARLYSPTAGSAVHEHIHTSALFRALRIAALFSCLLVEGVWAIVPRLAMLGVATTLVFALTFLHGSFRTRLAPLFLIPILVLIVTLSRSNFDLMSAGARFVNFCVAICLLNLYLTPPGYQSAELRPIELDLAFLLKWMSWQAIATFVLGYALPDIFMKIQVGDYSYRSAFYILNYHMMYLDTTIRPDGFFYERGVFQLYLNMYLYLALFRMRNLPQAALALVAIATTWSSTGLANAFFILVYYTLSNLRRIDALKLVFAVGLAIFVVLPFGLFVAGNLQNKFYGGESGSFMVRMVDLSSGLEVSAQDPLFGIGFDDGEITARLGRAIGTVQGVAADDLRGRTISNGILRMAINIGIPLMLLHLFGLARQTLFSHPLIIFTIVSLTLASESIPYNPFLLCIMYSGLLALVGKKHAKTASTHISRRTFSSLGKLHSVKYRTSRLP